MYELLPSIHFPPFKQGELEQSSNSKVYTSKWFVYSLVHCTYVYFMKEGKTFDIYSGLTLEQYRDRGKNLRWEGGGHISYSILGGHKTLFLTNSSKFKKYWGAHAHPLPPPPPCSTVSAVRGEESSAHATRDI